MVPVDVLGLFMMIRLADNHCQHLVHSNINHFVLYPIIRAARPSPVDILTLKIKTESSYPLFWQHLLESPTICPSLYSIVESFVAPRMRLCHIQLMGVVGICNPFPTTFRSEIRPNLFSFRPKFFRTHFSQSEPTQKLGRTSDHRDRSFTTTDVVVSDRTRGSIPTTRCGRCLPDTSRPILIVY